MPIPSRVTAGHLPDVVSNWRPRDFHFTDRFRLIHRHVHWQKDRSLEEYWEVALLLACLSWINFWKHVDEPRARGEVFNKFYTGSLRLLTFYMPFMMEMLPFSNAFHRKSYPFLLSDLRSGIFLQSLNRVNFRLRNLLIYLDESAVWCFCSGYFETPF